SFPEPFDAIFSNAALHWVKDYNGAARSMYDNLKPGGRLVLEMRGKGNVSTIAHTLQQILAEHGYIPQSTYFPWYFPTIGEYASVLEAAGFRVIYAHHYDRPTELKDTAAGIIDWRELFAEGCIHQCPDRCHARSAGTSQTDLVPGREMVRGLQKAEGRGCKRLRLTPDQVRSDVRIKSGSGSSPE